MLIDRDYKPGIIDAAITRAKSIPRSEALKRVVKSKSSKRPVHHWELLLGFFNVKVIISLLV